MNDLATVYRSVTLNFVTDPHIALAWHIAPAAAGTHRNAIAFIARPTSPTNYQPPPKSL